MHSHSKLLQCPPVRSHGPEVLLCQSKALATLVALKRLQTSTLLGRERELVILAHDAVKHEVIVKQHIVENKLARRAAAAQSFAAQRARLATLTQNITIPSRKEAGECEVMQVNLDTCYS